MKKYLLSAAALVLSAAGVSAVDQTKLVDRIQDASVVLRELRDTPDKGIPDDLWTKAECVVVIPGVKKGAFIVGGEYGKGIASCRDKSGWSAPSFFMVSKGSVGFQIGGENVDLVLLVMNDRGMHRLLEDKVTLGGEASVAGGPVGRDVRAMTDAQLRAEMLSYSRAQGVFAGVNLSGGVLQPDKDYNEALYGRRVAAREILVDRTVKSPSAAAPFMRELQRPAAAAASR